MMTRTLLVAFLTLLAAVPTEAHTWLEDAHVVAGNGTMIGAAGYPRGNVLRSDTAAFSDSQMTYLIPPNGRSTGNAILSTDLMCKPSQTIGNQTAGSPALSASPGDMIALRYQENGHVTLPQNQPGKPANRGTVFIYGTSSPSNSDTLLSIHKVWNAAGTGGDGRGVLLATQNFDDGQCYQVNGGNISVERQKEFPHVAENTMGVNLWCQSDFTIPTTVKTTGQYSIYWVWDWPTAAGTPGQEAGLNETYTTCLDINMVSGTGTSKSLDFQSGQDLNSAAIQTELSTAYVVTTGTATNEQATSEPAATVGTATSSSSPNTVTSAQTMSASTNAPVSASGDAAGMVTVTVEASPVTQYITVTATVTPGQMTMTMTSSMAAVATLESGSMVAIPASVQSSATSSTSYSTIPSPVGSSVSVQPFVAGSQTASTTKSLSAAGTASATIRGRVVALR